MRKIIDDRGFQGHARALDLEARISEMIFEACATLGIEPGGDESERWGAVLEAIRLLRHGGLSLDDYKKLEAWAADPNRQDPNTAFAAGAARDAANAVARALVERAAVAPIGWVLIDKDEHPGYGGMFPSEECAEAKRDRLNRPGQPLYACAPWRVVPVGPIREMKPYGWGVLNSAERPMIHLTESAKEFADESVAKFAGGTGSPYRAVELFYFVSPPDRPAEAAEPEVNSNE